MKMQRVELYVMDFDDFGKEEVMNYLDHAMTHAGMIIHTGDVDEVTIDDWTDEHELNQLATDSTVFNKYFKE